jgi:putative tryptophan/tyrosine transport system substrate-binding protein
MPVTIGRRKLITALGGTAATWPLAARAQQAAMPVVGFLWAGSPERMEPLIAAFRKGLSETGYVEGRNVAIEYRFAQNEYHRLSELAVDLVRHRVAVLATPGTTIAAVAAKAATTTIPIVFSTAADPVQAGLVESINRPGGNVTGVSYMNTELAAKRLGLLHELLPGATRFAVLINPDGPMTESVVAELQAAASVIGRQIEVLSVRTNREIDAAFASFVQKRSDGLLINPEPLFLDRQVQILTLATRHAVASIYPARFWADAGGLMSYGSSFTDQFRQAGIYTGRVLKGEKPADMPILRATKFEFVINLQTARTFGLDVPATLLARADEVIE